MSTTCEHEDVLAAYRSSRRALRDQALLDAYNDVHADSLLAQMLEEATRSHDRVVLAAHLGDLRGAAGDAALRQVADAAGPGTTDLRAAALLALAKRLGPEATRDLEVGLDAANAVVKDYAVIGLAGAGDDRAWDQVLSYLRAVLRRAQRSAVQSEAAMAVAYLARHGADPERHTQLVDFIRDHWAAIDEEEWFARLWPAIAPGGPPRDLVPAPDAAAFQEWARHPLFQPLGPPTV